jgi:two-component system chemotaxis response regulator CheB
VEPDDKAPILQGTVYLAPADYHMLIEAADPCDGPASYFFSLSNDDLINYSRPSIDVLLESAADACGPAVIGVLLTGANADGAAGLARIRKRGGLTLVQDPESAEAPDMPQAALAAGAADKVLPIEEIAAFLEGLVHSPTKGTEKDRQ